MPDYMVLRNAAAVRTASPFESFGPGAAMAPTAAAPEPRVEMHDISTREAASIARDPEVAAVAIPMPTTLIKPLEQGAGAAAARCGALAAEGRSDA